jgi:hypothetical protein
VLAELPDMRDVLAEADPSRKAELYASLNLRMRYRHPRTG